MTKLVPSFRKKCANVEISPPKKTRKCANEEISPPRKKSHKSLRFKDLRLIFEVEKKFSITY